MRRRGTNLPRMGDFNRSVILEAIRRSDGVSRTELVDATGLSAQTVTNITRRLLDEGLITEAGRTIAGPGKPRTTLRLCPESRLAVGVHLDPSRTTYVLLDLAGSVLAHRTQRTSMDDPEVSIRAMAQEIGHLLDERDVDRAVVAGIGVATPGPLDAERGTVVEPPKLSGWHTVPVQDALAAATGLPVALEKDTTAAASAELWSGDDPPGISFVFVYVGVGIGAALVMAGQVVRGASRNVGEIGHLIVDPGGPVCACGRRGCVDVTCTPDALVRDAERAGVFAAVGVPEGATLEDKLTILSERAAVGEDAAIAVMRRAVRNYAVLISTLTNMLDVDRVVLGGPLWTPLATMFLAELPALIDEASATRAVRQIPVDETIVGDDVGAIGGACLVLDDVLSPRASTLIIDG